MPAQPIPRNVPPKVGSARGLVAALCQSGASAELIEAARAQLAEAKAEVVITRLSLPIEARARLARLLLGGGNDAA